MGFPSDARGGNPSGALRMTDGDWDTFFRCVVRLLDDAATLGAFVAADAMQRAAAERNMTGKLMEFRNVYR